MASPQESAAPFAHLSRRADVRWQVFGQLFGHLVADDVPLVVLNLGAGGFAAESPVPFNPGTAHQVQFSTENGTTITVDCEAVHCMRSRTLIGFPRYLAGFKFVTKPGDAAASAAIDALIHSALPVLTYES
jgi:hypothetical protein